jgi:alkylhydroperoxidase family enzyme
MTTTESPRLAPVPRDACRPDIAPLLAAGTQATGGADNVSATLAHHPGLYKRYAPFVGKLLTAGRLPSRDREILILRTAWRCRCEYEWAHHQRIGAEAGLDAETISAIGDGPGAVHLHASDRTLVRLVDALLDEHTIDDELFTALGERYDEAGVIEALMLVGNYAMLAGVLNSLRVQLEGQ